MYNVKDIQFVGKYDFDKESSLSEGTWNTNFSVGIFRWELKNDGKSMKKGKTVLRISGRKENKEKVFEFAENAVKDLDNNLWDGRKSVLVK